MGIGNITGKIIKQTGRNEVQEQVHKAKHSKSANTEGIIKNILPKKRMPEKI